MECVGQEGSVLFQGEVQDDGSNAVAEEGGNRHEELAAKINLTELQREALIAYQCGGSVMQAAKRLSRSYKSVQESLLAIRNKLGLSSITELADSSMVTGDAIASSEQAITEARLLTLLEHAGFKCALSGLPLEPDNANLDHKVPISQGGEHSLDNVHWVRKEINAMKGTMDVDEFVSFCCAVAAHARLPRKTGPSGPN